MDKILLGMGRNEGKVEVTNDGATILKNIEVVSFSVLTFYI